MARASLHSRGIRWIAALGAALLVAGCGTRLDDARIEAAAGLGQTAASAILSAIKLWPDMFKEDHEERTMPEV